MPKKTAEPNNVWSKELTPYRILKLCTLLIAFIFLVISYGHGFFWVNAVIWACLILLLFIFKINVSLSIFLLIASIIISLYVTLSAQNNMFWGEYLTEFKRVTSSSTNKTYTDSAMMEEGEIRIEAEHGTLSNEGENSYLGESARGNEAYLGEGGATISYSFVNPVDETYDVSVRVHDDGLHPDGSRNATLQIGAFELPYTHIAEDTKGWKWVTVGTVTLSEGTINVTITKNETTSAAFVLDAFKLVPVK